VDDDAVVEEDMMVCCGVFAEKVVISRLRLHTRTTHPALLGNGQPMRTHSLQLTSFHSVTLQKPFQTGKHRHSHSNSVTFVPSAAQRKIQHRCSFELKRGLAYSDSPSFTPKRLYKETASRRRSISSVAVVFVFH